jgi:hypothetical protein
MRRGSQRDDIASLQTPLASAIKKGLILKREKRGREEGGIVRLIPALIAVEWLILKLNQAGGAN